MEELLCPHSRRCPPWRQEQLAGWGKHLLQRDDVRIALSFLQENAFQVVLLALPFGNARSMYSAYLHCISVLAISYTGRDAIANSEGIKKMGRATALDARRRKMGEKSVAKLYEKNC